MMPRIMRRSLGLFLFSILLSGGTGDAGTDSLYETYSRRAEVKVFVSIPTDTSDKKALDPAVLKAALEKSFSERKSIHFHPVPSEADADLALDAETQGFIFSESDPVDMLIGVEAAAMDAATVDHFAAADVLFTVREAKGQKVLWKEKLHASVTDHTMTEAESKDKIAGRLGEVLMREAFGKKKR